MNLSKNFSTLLILAATTVFSIPADASEFAPPRIRNFPVDRCAKTMGGPVDCGSGSTEFAARSFCKRMGYSTAVRWTWRDSDNQVGNYIVKPLYRNNHEYAGFKFVPNKGGFTFTSIQCE